MRVIIMGASRIGSLVADMLEKDNHEVIVIDISPDGFNRLSEGFKGQKIIGSGTDPGLLKKLNFTGKDGFMAATNSENANIAAVNMVKKTYGCQRVAKLVFDPFRAKAFKEVEKGIVCPTYDAAVHSTEALTA
ncbi:MAG: TrkA family potassium uptake protein [candidate division Zixibacteria bacterium]|nr:TrkA family potassium uptake protein [candidate division Zixibacteria bacterium]